MLSFKLKPIAFVVSGLIAFAPNISAADLTLDRIDVIGVTPLHSSGTPINDVPSNVQVVKGDDLKNQQSVSVTEYMANNLPGVNINETSNNPFMAEVNFHGFTASPLLGQPQGLSVYQDGVRINQPFGDTVNWDLIPTIAIAGINLMPGSNPLFGLNTLGGAISIQTKSGDLFQGGSAQVYGGAWGRRAAEAEYGGNNDNGLNFYVAANNFHEDGWRESSSTDVRQIFTKVGWKGEKSDFNISLNLADNEMNGNGLTPQSMLLANQNSVYTQPDNTKTKQGFITGQLNHWFTDNLAFNSVAYYRNIRTKTAGVDVGDDTAGVVNYSNNNQDVYGVGGQLNWVVDKNQLIVGASYDHSSNNYTQGSRGFDAFSQTRGVGDVLQEYLLATSLHGTSKTWSVFATDTYKLTPNFAFTASGRYNHTAVNNFDNIIQAGEAGSLTSTQAFQRFNPALGFTFSPVDSLNFFAGYNEGSRAPSSIELGCSDPNNPCVLPNAMQGDPPLKQVVSRTFEGGVRGRLDSTSKWSVAAYTSENSNDIQFMTDSSHIGTGWFANVGQTRRSGLDMSFSSKLDSLRWMVGYSFVNATYESTFDLNSNSSASVDGQIKVNPGDRIPGIPKHQLKLRGEYDVLHNWVVGATAVAFSDQYIRGNENNADPSGKIGGYAILNLDTRVSLGNSGWQAFGKVNNVFDQSYYTSGLFATNFFNSDNPEKFLAPGAPRAGWIGLRYEFGGAKKSTIDRD